MVSKKIGKNRLDKYYHLAKEQGYRARSAYKLIQINKKHGIMDNIDSAIDLCAAPGGWTQVLSKHMKSKKEKTLIAIDLDKIKPITGVITMQNDITTEDCYNNLRQIIKSEKVDLVLNDGAPNVGTSWDKDAFVQNELTLHSAKLANKFLKKGGHFVTKIFKSTEFMNLLFVFKKMFEKVEISKPLSSRAESAEVFAVCKNFQGNDLSDDFFDPKKIFKTQDDVIERKDTIKFSEFMKSLNPEKIFKNYRKVVIDNEEEFYRVYNDDDLYCFSDLQQNSQADVRKLLRRRQKLLKMNNIFENVKGEKEVEEEIIIDNEKSKVSKIKRELKKMEKENKKNEDYKLLRLLRTEKLKLKVKRKAEKKSGLQGKDDKLNFYEDDLFEDSNVDENFNYNDNVADDNEVSSDVESFSHSEDEKGLIVEYQKDNEKFKERTVNRFVHDDHEDLPSFYKEEEEEYYKMEPEDKHSAKLKRREAKKLEFSSRQIRRGDKFKSKLIEENKDKDIKRLNKKALKHKENENPKKVLRVRSGRKVTLRRGIRVVDKRMKKDYKNKDKKKK